VIPLYERNVFTDISHTILFPFPALWGKVELSASSFEEPSRKGTFSRFWRLFTHGRLIAWVCACPLVFLRLFHPGPPPIGCVCLQNFTIWYGGVGWKKNRFLFSIFFVEHMTKCHQQASEAMRRVKGATNVCVCVCVRRGRRGQGACHLPVEILQPLPISEERITKIERCVCRTQGYKSNKDNLNDTYCRQHIDTQMGIPSL